MATQLLRTHNPHPKNIIFHPAIYPRKCNERGIGFRKIINPLFVLHPRFSSFLFLIKSIFVKYGNRNTQPWKQCWQSAFLHERNAQTNKRNSRDKIDFVVTHGNRTCRHYRKTGFVFEPNCARFFFRYAAISVS
jgi:hypothetical protein